MLRVPFEIPDVHGGLSEASGMLYREEEFLVFEFQIETLGFKQAPRTIKVELPVVVNMRLVPGIFSDRLCIIPKKLALLDALPGSHKGEAKLKVAKRYRDDVEALIEDVLANA